MNLYPHQTEALRVTAGRNRVAYYMDMGLGKTFVGAEKLMILGAEINLVVCQKSKVQDWIDHFSAYYFCQVYDLTRKNDLKAFLTETPSMPMIGIINYDLIWRRKELSRLQGFTLMLDESSLIQNGAAKRSKFIMNLNPLNVILLSGTPTSGKYENLWTQIHLLGWPISEAVYNRQYVNWVTAVIDGFPRRMVDSENPYKHVDRLKNKLRESGAFFLKTEECFDLPEQTFIPLYVPTTRAYWTFRKKKIVTVEGKELIGDTVFSERLYSRMLCGQYNPGKLQAFADLLDSTLDRFIVFYNFNAELAALREIALAHGRRVSEVNGQTKDLTAYDEDEASVTLIQYQAGAMGLNLQKAHRIVYFTLTDKSELYEQSKKRIHRIGQNRSCFYYLLLCRNSVEERILETLNLRRDYTDELFKYETEVKKV